MAQRAEPHDSLDDFPTPPWATRALFAHVLPPQVWSRQTCLEPSCGAGHMARVLREHFAVVKAADIHDYGYGKVSDFLTTPYPTGSFDWVITNPPFRLAEDFIVRALAIARVGVAMFARTALIEGVARYERLFRPHPPTLMAQFTERVPIFRGRLDGKGSTATAYAWFVWMAGEPAFPLAWIPPCRRALERPGDYDLAPVPPAPFPAEAPEPATEPLPTRPVFDLFS
mgnify:CR=1 FL=1